jgi:taurine---2-oxoglutarate transaminase
MELVSDGKTRTPLVAWQGQKHLHGFFNDLLAHGLYIYGRYNVAIVAPPLTISVDELDEGFAILDAALTRLSDEAHDATSGSR